LSILVFSLVLSQFVYEKVLEFVLALKKFIFYSFYYFRSTVNQ